MTRNLFRAGLALLLALGLAGQAGRPAVAEGTATGGGATPAPIPWRPINGPGLPPLADLNINVIVADPIHPKTVYLGTSQSYGQYGGVYRTTNGGLTWSPFNNGLPAGAAIDMMAITPDGGMLYARNSLYASLGLYRSAAGSAAWTKVTTPTCCDAGAIFSMYVNSQSMLYIGTYGNGLFKSGSQGDSWTKLVTSPQNTINTIAGVSTDVNLMYVAVSGPYKTSDGGQKWTYVSSFSTNVCDFGYVDTIAINPGDNQVVLIGDDLHCLVRSDDGGTSWTKVYQNAGVNKVIIDPHNTSMAYLSAKTFGLSHDGVMQSIDGGKTWADYNSGLPWKGATGFDLGPGEAGKPSVLYAGMVYKGVYTTAPPTYYSFLPIILKK